MSSFERRVRNTINPYSTAFSRWWCQSGRYLAPVRMITGHYRAGRYAAGPARPRPRATAGSVPPPAVMDGRRAALDAQAMRAVNCAPPGQAPGRA